MYYLKAKCSYKRMVRGSRRLTWESQHQSGLGSGPSPCVWTARGWGSGPDWDWGHGAEAERYWLPPASSPPHAAGSAAEWQWVRWAAPAEGRHSHRDGSQINLLTNQQEDTAKIWGESPPRSSIQIFLSIQLVLALLWQTYSLWRGRFELEKRTIFIHKICNLSNSKSELTVSIAKILKLQWRQF